MVSVKKIVELKGQPTNSCDGISKMKIYHQPIPSQPFLGRPFDFTTFFTQAILNQEPFFTVLEYIIIYLLRVFFTSAYCDFSISATHILERTQQKMLSPGTN